MALLWQSIKWREKERENETICPLSGPIQVYIYTIRSETAVTASLSLKQPLVAIKIELSYQNSSEK